MKSKSRTVVDKVNELIAKQNEVSDESSAEETEPRITEFDDDEYEFPQAQSTEFRKHNVKLLSEQSAKYKGKVSSRKELEAESEDDAEETMEEQEGSVDAANSDFYEESDSEDDDNESHADIDEYDDDDAFRKYSSQMNGEEPNEPEEDEQAVSEEEEEAEEEEDVSQAIVSERNREAEMEKANAVKNQLNIWERLLEMRIKTQKVLTLANDLPEQAEIQEVPGATEAQQKAATSLISVINKICALQVAFGQQNPEFNEHMQFTPKRLELNNDEPDEAFSKFNDLVQTDFEKFRAYSNKVLLKYDDRSRLLKPGAFKRKSTQDYNILKKIEHRISSRKAQYEQELAALKEEAVEETESETTAKKRKRYVYDDTDFYHQQLREFIEYKANTSSSMSEVTRQYVELQKVRQTMKKKVDTRASKGRKIR